MAVDDLQSELFRAVCERNKALRLAEQAERRIVLAAEALKKRADEQSESQQSGSKPRPYQCDYCTESFHTVPERAHHEMVCRVKWQLRK